jgi:hypothetical protein
MFHPLLFPWTDLGLRALDTQISTAQWMAQTWQQWVNTTAQGASPREPTIAPARRVRPKRSARPVASKGK